MESEYRENKSSQVKKETIAPEFPSEIVSALPPIEDSPQEPVKVEPTPLPSALVVKTVLLESQTESLEGQRAVFAVIDNRSKLSEEPRKKVVLAPKQFSCWNKTAPEKVVIEGDLNAYAKQLTETNKIKNEKIAKYATHYHNPKLATPKYYKKALKLGAIGNHVFYCFKQEKEKLDLLQ